MAVLMTNVARLTCECGNMQDINLAWSDANVAMARFMAQHAGCTAPEQAAVQQEAPDGRGTETETA